MPCDPIGLPRLSAFSTFGTAQAFTSEWGITATIGSTHGHREAFN